MGITADIMEPSSPAAEKIQRRYTDEEIDVKIADLPRLASLKNINNALSELLSSEYSITSQIAEVIRRDPSLTSRLLKLVNSVFYGMADRVSSIEDAVFFLGWRQVRELAAMTPVIEEIDQLCKGDRYERWQKLWKHSIGTAILTREIYTALDLPRNEDTDYIMGLVHNIGIIVIGIAFSEELDWVLSQSAKTPDEICRLERAIIGWDHARIGSAYLKRHQMSHEIVEAVRYHNCPEDAPVYTKQAAALQVADHLVQSAGVSGFEECTPLKEIDIRQLAGWRLLFKGAAGKHEKVIAASLKHTISRLPFMLKGMI